MNILSFQSQVVYGHVGNSAAQIALHCLGHDVWAMPTVLFSSHAGYARVTGEALAADLLRKLLDGLDSNGWLAQCGAVLSGYLGHADQAAVVADAVRRVKRVNPNALYCLDPVFGDAGRAFAKPGVAEAIARHLLPLADIITPNAFELSSLTSLPIREADDAVEAARRLCRPCVLATSVPLSDDRIGTLAFGGGEAWLAATPRLDGVPHGSGDLLAALFLGHRLAGDTLNDALARAAASIFHVLSESVRSSSQEMLLIENQDALVSPPDNPALRVERVA